jgi:probable F420-dependent oxidoreductase
MGGVKVRIGIGLGGAGVPAQFTKAVALLEEAHVDSLWLPEMVFGPLVEPFIGMAHALAITSHLKVGTGVAVLPGRHPVLVAKQLTTLAGLAPARVLPVFGLQPARPPERPVFSVPSGRRAAVFDESLELLRLLVRQENVTFHGEFFSVESASVGPLPAKPLDIWLGGSAPAALQRIGRLGDGWLASFLSPAEAGAGRQAIEAAAAAAGRAIDDDHYGISVPVAAGPIPSDLVAAVGSRRPGADPSALIASGWPQARRMVGEYVAAGLSKFVIRPAETPPDLGRFVEEFAREMMPLQT